eukprot:Nk52_evm18s230 gene=Nk52_evmTU18s230
MFQSKLYSQGFALALFASTLLLLSGSGALGAEVEEREPRSVTTICPGYPQYAAGMKVGFKNDVKIPLSFSLKNGLGQQIKVTPGIFYQDYYEFCIVTDTKDFHWEMWAYDSQGVGHLYTQSIGYQLFLDNQYFMTLNATTEGAFDPPFDPYATDYADKLIPASFLMFSMLVGACFAGLL